VSSYIKLKMTVFLSLNSNCKSACESI